MSPVSASCGRGRISIFISPSTAAPPSLTRNLIAEKLRLQRGAVFNRSDFYEDYLDLC